MSWISPNLRNSMFWNNLMIIWAFEKIHLGIIWNSHGQPEVLEALDCGPFKISESLKSSYFGSKLSKSLENVQILALSRTIFQKCDPRPILVWPWLELTTFPKCYFILKHVVISDPVFSKFTIEFYFRF